jgi:hypothetical protein
MNKQQSKICLKTDITRIQVCKPTLTSYYLILIAEKRMGYITTQDIGSVYFFPELIPNFQSIPQGGQITDQSRRSFVGYQYGSAPSIAEEAVRARVSGSPLTDNKPQSKEYSRSVKGLASPLMTKLGLFSSNQNTQTSNTKSQSQSQNFELYVNSQSENTKIILNYPPETSPAVRVQEIPRTSVPLVRNFVPNIYNKIEISYVTNNYQASTPTNFIRAGSEQGYQSANLPVKETISNLNESYNLETQKFRDNTGTIVDFELSGQGAVIGAAENRIDGLMSQSYNLQTSGTDIQTLQPEETQRSENFSIAGQISQRAYHFKDDAQYRSLHELTPTGKPKAESSRGSPATFLNKPPDLHLAKDNVKSQIFPQGNSAQNPSYLKSADSQASTKRSFLSKLDKITQRYPFDFTKSSKITGRKSKPAIEIQANVQKTISGDAKAKISKKINTIFKRIGMTVLDDPASRVLKTTRDRETYSNASIRLHIKQREHSTSSVNDLLKKLGGKKSLRNSVLTSNNTLDAAWSRLRTSRGRQTSSSRVIHTGSMLHDTTKSDSQDVTIYNVKGGIGHGDYSPKDGQSYNLLYRKDKALTPKAQVQPQKNIEKHSIKSVLDQHRKLYIRPAIVNLNLLSKYSPSIIATKISALAQQLWQGKDLVVNEDDYHGVTIKLGKNSFLFRVEALEELEGLYTVVLYPKYIKDRVSYLKNSTDLLRLLEL